VLTERRPHTTQLQAQIAGTADEEETARRIWRTQRCVELDRRGNTNDGTANGRTSTGVERDGVGIGRLENILLQWRSVEDFRGSLRA